MDPFLFEISQQAETLRRFTSYYFTGEGAGLLSTIGKPRLPIITGMGASYHAALAMGTILQNAGIPALIAEAADLLNYGFPLLQESDNLLYISQSGASAEVEPVIGLISPQATLVAVTNDPHSPLGRRADITLPIKVDSESTVATKTYLNSLALLWLLFRHWSGKAGSQDFETLLLVADRVEELTSNGMGASLVDFDVVAKRNGLVFVGHGPHAATARHAAMVVGEWAKMIAVGYSAGAFRHGFIEFVQPGTGVVVFAPPGITSASAHTLAREVEQYGAAVTMVTNGLAHSLAEKIDIKDGFDEFLSPILDIIPVQLFTHSLARERNTENKFRYISKVIDKL